jgi:autotransporter translocation and assembly factor TamB
MAEIARPDLSAFGNLGAIVNSADAEQLINQMKANLARTNAMRDRVRDLVGEARTDDGHVRATYTATAGLAELTIDPRAMRLPSKELAARIVALTAAARADLERQRAEIVAESGHDAAELSPERSEAMLSELTSAYARGMGDIQTVFDRFRSQRDV